MRRERMVTSQVSGESLGRPPSVGSWLCAGKNSRASHSKVKEGLFREIHTPHTVCGPSRKVREAFKGDLNEQRRDALCSGNVYFEIIARQKCLK